MIKKIIIPLYHDEVAPRFDLATEVQIIIISKYNEIEEEHLILMPHASAEKLCRLILTENINTLICGAIKDEHYQFLRWKKSRYLILFPVPGKLLFIIILISH